MGVPTAIDFDLDVIWEVPDLVHTCRRNPVMLKRHPFNVNEIMSLGNKVSN
jgi:hypothetical protein